MLWISLVNTLQQCLLLPSRNSSLRCLKLPFLWFQCCFFCTSLPPMFWCCPLLLLWTWLGLHHANLAMVLAQLSLPLVELRLEQPLAQRWFFPPGLLFLLLQHVSHPVLVLALPSPTVALMPSSSLQFSWLTGELSSALPLVMTLLATELTVSWALLALVDLLDTQVLLHLALPQMLLALAALLLHLLQWGPALQSQRPLALTFLWLVLPFAS